MESKPKRYEITDLTEIRIGSEVRWKGKVKFPDTPRGKSMIVFQIKDELIAVPSKCPHEGYTLDNSNFVNECEIECVAHQNIYSLLPGGIPTYKVMEDGDTMYVIRHNYYNFFRSKK